ncbi:response regulator transcription factor [Hymenobacter arizonensis]|uniref:DNA-binding response regulator, OmpR family, contains REC and winged-helix (WHTH) domain n=1 Tax=Hymenobacter arizonensis TaxID=1227077 RepID=A0A1I5V379_HYMAR|nr:response regulator transcription factor [Hymenobacter arizonensis]SFQ02014.1 DNA-binding response regulator, OmpR family, contains REC and winged-helix (wHTH) domain [Hymenobacter arizonensis]
MPTILLIEDEPSLGLIVKDSLESRGFTVQYAADGEAGLQLFQLRCPDIVVADVMMPKLDGFSMAEQIRRENATVPILFLTARSQPADVVRGFELGGNDYLKKPFSMDELIVRIKALLSRQPAAAPVSVGPLAIGRYQFDHPKQKLRFGSHEEALTNREAELLKRLYDQRNQVLERTAVLRELWGDDSFFNGRSLDVFITRLRRCLKEDPQVQIVNIRGIGYKLIL